MKVKVGPGFAAFGTCCRRQAAAEILLLSAHFARRTTVIHHLKIVERKNTSPTAAVKHFGDDFSEFQNSTEG